MLILDQKIIVPRYDGTQDAEARTSFIKTSVNDELCAVNLVFEHFLTNHSEFLKTSLSLSPCLSKALIIYCLPVSLPMTYSYL